MRWGLGSSGMDESGNIRLKSVAQGKSVELLFSHFSVL